MAIQTRTFDAAEYLDDDEAIEAYLQKSLDIALEISDPSFLTQALGTVARARGMSQIAQAAGLSRESLYKSLIRQKKSWVSEGSGSFASE